MKKGADACNVSLSSAPGLPKKVVAELVGTFIFVLVGAGSALGTPAGSDPAASLVAAALANGLGLGVAVSATMGISGGALNPAVSIGLLVGKKLSARDTVLYITAEMVGATVAGLALVISFPSSIGKSVGWGAPSLSHLLTDWQGIAIEALLTFVLVTVVYGTAVDSRAPRIGGLAIGMAVVADVLVGGNLTGAAMNPARALGPMFFVSPFPGYWYIYIVGPIIGAIAAGLVYRYLLEARSDKGTA